MKTSLAESQQLAVIWIILLLGAVLGGQMSCAAKNSGIREMPKWTGKFPILVIAHRGFSGKAPENTLASFKKAMEAGADVIEFDVRFSRDGHLIVFHDDTLERTTKGK